MAFNIKRELDDQARREEGTWVEIAEDASVLMSDPRSITFQKALQKAEISYRKRHGIRAGKDLSSDQRADVMWRAMFQHIVKDWKGIEDIDDKGKVAKVAFTLENFLRLMNEVWRFREAVMAFATDEDTFDDVDDREELAKNSD